MNPYLESGLYTINSDYELLSFNHVLAQKYPEMRKGIHCYEVINGTNHPCRYCPIYNKSSENHIVYFSKKKKYWVSASFAITDDPNIVTVITTTASREVREKEELHRMQLEAMNEELQQMLNMNKIFLNAMPPDFVACAIVDLVTGLQRRLLRRGTEITEVKVPLLWDDFLRDVINAHMTNPEEIAHMRSLCQLHMLAEKKPGDVMRFDYFTSYQSPDGTSKPVTTTMAFFEQDGQPYMTIFTTGNIKIEYERKLTEEVEKLRQQDIRQRAELEKALLLAQDASRAKSDFLSNISHDIRTPMNAIMGFTALAVSRVDQPDKVSDYLDKINTSSRYMLDLINGVLDLNRIEHGNLRVEDNAEQISEMIQGLQIMLQPQLDEKNIQFSVDMTRVQSTAVFCDKVRLKQVLLNIIGNAVKYSGENSLVTLRIEQLPCEKDGYARYVFSIKDTGKGIGEEFLQHIFEPFEREEAHGTSRIQGTGLGLAICKNIIDMMGGTITVESELGKGSEFVLDIPLRLQKTGGQNKDSKKLLERKQSKKFTDMKILLAEDNELNREIVTELLSELGFVIDIAEDGKIAVEKVQQFSADTYDVILMDIQMPNMNGYDAARKIRAMSDRQKANIPIIAMTANAFNEDKKRALDCGMNQHISKPFDISELLELIIELA